MRSWLEMQELFEKDGAKPESQDPSHESPAQVVAAQSTKQSSPGAGSDGTRHSNAEPSAEVSLKVQDSGTPVKGPAVGTEADSEDASASKSGQDPASPTTGSKASEADGASVPGGCVAETENYTAPITSETDLGSGSKSVERDATEETVPGASDMAHATSSDALEDEGARASTAKEDEIRSSLDLQEVLKLEAEREALELEVSDAIISIFARRPKIRPLILPTLNT